MSKVFISYRRNDSAGYAQAIYSRLTQRFSKDRLFMDVATIEPGVDFERVIETAVGECDVLLAIIGKRWLRDDVSGTAPLENPKDYVCLEISTALARGIRVIPVLVDGVIMPGEETLPAALRSLSRRHAVDISNSPFDFDVERLISAVHRGMADDEIHSPNDRTDHQVTSRPKLIAQPR